MQLTIQFLIAVFGIVYGVYVLKNNKENDKVAHYAALTMLIASPITIVALTVIVLGGGL